MKKYFLLSFLIFYIIFGITKVQAKNFIIFSPVYGWHYNYNNNVGGDQGYQTGLFSLAKYNNFVFNIYPFYTRANHSNINGILFYTNYYKPIKNSNFSLNFGIGDIFHKIETKTDIPYMSNSMPPSINTYNNLMTTKINVPLPKIGFLYKNKNLKINPYYCRIRESSKITVTKKDLMTSLIPETKAHYYYNLYGINLEYSYHHFWSNTIKYYFNDRKNRKDTFTFRYRTYLSLNKKYGVLLRYEYDQHTTGLDKSILAGPFIIL